MKKINGIIDCVFKNKINFLILTMTLFNILVATQPYLDIEIKMFFQPYQYGRKCCYYKSVMFSEIHI